jgi:hypothetical protein
LVDKSTERRASVPLAHGLVQAGPHAPVVRARSGLYDRRTAANVGGASGSVFGGSEKNIRGERLSRKQCEQHLEAGVGVSTTWRAVRFQIVFSSGRPDEVNLYVAPRLHRRVQAAL